ncbi:MAG: sulfite exporter TauE/SafE family protein [Pseudomonadota bacterium]
MITVLTLGFLIGLRHALDADHVAAVASLVVSAKSVKSSLWQGAVWGVGHTLTLFTIGAFVVLSETSIAPQLSGLLEAAVGGMLILLGLDIARKMIRDNVHFHAHTHEDGSRHVHAHKHNVNEIHDESAHDHSHAPAFPHRALAVGLMHGLAGSAALILVALDTSRPVWEGLTYIFVFGLGSIAGMAVLSAAIAVPITRSHQISRAYHQVIQAAVGVANVAIGGTLIVGAIGTAA